MTIDTLIQQSLSARPHQRVLTLAQRNHALLQLADALAAGLDVVLAANQQDLALADSHNLSTSTRQRLTLTPAKWQPAVAGLRQLAQLPDPLDRTLRHTLLDDDLTLRQHTVPLGTLLVIFEARPDVLPQVAGLALKSGNCLIAKGGQETTHTNRAILNLMQAAYPSDLPTHWLQAIEGREAVHDLLQHPEAIDLVIPRGSNAMVQHIMASTRIPVLGHADGICHLYWHTSSDTAKALATVLDAKTHYPAACNALETLLLDAALAAPVLPLLQQACQAAGVTLKGCEQTRQYLPELAPVEDWATEYGDLVLAVRLVSGLTEAMAHIERYGSHHTDGILADDATVVQAFLAGVDSASVYANASTRFADGYRYGLGAEVGISTSRTHARGPVGLDGLVSTRWVLQGQYHTVAPYTGDAAQPFRHQPLTD
jgi:glutamate-5-semialdehyde dehydrogenase